MKCSLKVQVSNRQCFTLGSAASGMKIFLNIQRWFQCRVFMMYILRTLVLGLRSFTLFFLKHKDRRLRSGGCSAYESLSRIQCDPQSATSGFEAEFPSANNTVVQESPTLDLTPSPLSCPSMAPPSGLLPCFHGNQSLSRPLNSPLGHLLTTGVPRGTFCGLQVAHGSPARSSRPFLVGLPGCPPAPLGLSPPRLSVQILRCPCPVPGWTPTSVLMIWMSVLSAGLSAAQNVLRSLMSRERDLPSPPPCAPLPRSPVLPPCPCPRSLWHGAQQSGNLDTSRLPPLPVWPGHSPSASLQALLSHTWMPALVTTSSTWARGTHHALVRDSLLLKSPGGFRVSLQELLPLQAFLSHRPVCST